MGKAQTLPAAILEFRTAFEGYMSEIVSKAGAAEWRRFRSRVSRTSYAREDACLNLPARPLTFWLGTRKPKRFLYTSKEFFFHMWSTSTHLPEDVAICHQGGIPSRGYCEMLKRQSEWLGLPVLFVGDLDPLDLTIFAALASGDPDLRHSPATAPPIQYLGIDDRWLNLCARRLSARRRGLDTVSIKLGETEREHLEVVKHIFPRLDHLIGPRCFQLLEEGRKLELEGAANPGIYGRGFMRQLGQLLLREGSHRDDSFRHAETSGGGGQGLKAPRARR